MSVLGAILGKRTWLGAGAILLSAAGGCALGALLMVKGVLPETGTLAWSCGCWVLASFAGARLAIRGRGEGTLPAALAAALAAYPLAWLAGVALGDPSFRGGRPVSDCRPVCGRRGGGAAGQREAPEKAPGPPRTDPEARKAEIGHGENHENAPAAKKHLTPDYTDRDHL